MKHSKFNQDLLDLKKYVSECVDYETGMKNYPEARKYTIIRNWIQDIIDISLQDESNKNEPLTEEPLDISKLPD